ncbi:MAG: prolipoprotein diacylglyceryl transferase [Bacteroidetes bacterium]|nr:prolipoprotein diacylglyceryl transferase [Bacteroidota bacterium]
MRPILFKIAGIPIYSFGLMMGLGFLIANYLLTLELKRKKINPEFANNVTFRALVGGIVGSKILYLLEHWKYFIENPFQMAFSPGGLTFYGGFIFAIYLIWHFCKKNNISFLTIADATAPGLLFAYGFARIGCHLAGDGDYGFPTNLPWGTDYSNGTYPPSYAFKNFPEITSQFVNGIVPDTILCHPTPIYEFLICTFLFLILWFTRKNDLKNGSLFMKYLFVAGFERFLIEFVRINDRFIYGLSEAQLIAISLILIGSVGYFKINKPQKIITV